MGENHTAAALPPRLSAFVQTLKAHDGPLDSETLLRCLNQADLHREDLSAFVCVDNKTYHRARVVLTDRFEVLVMTWAAGQQSAPHDHAGSTCGFRVFGGSVVESRYAVGADGLVAPQGSVQMSETSTVADMEGVHALAHGQSHQAPVVTLHVYAPPLPELRRYSPRLSGSEPLQAFTSDATPNAPRVVVIGGGFSGTLTAAHLIKRASQQHQPLHVTLIDPQAAFGEGPAYRTADGQHLLNVPACKMSAWPDAPNDFLQWAQKRDASVGPWDFLSRRDYGAYIRSCLLDVVAQAAPGVTIEMRRDTAVSVKRDHSWHVQSQTGHRMGAEAVVIATGHRAPADPLANVWQGSRLRWVGDPWASLTLSAIDPNEPVVLLGSGLTAVDVLLTLTRKARKAPVVSLSRRGLMSLSHTDPSAAAWPMGERLHELKGMTEGVRTRELLRRVLCEVAEAQEQGVNWRQVVDGLRSHTPRFWAALTDHERVKFLRHVRPFWEIHRHRMATEIGRAVQSHMDAGLFCVRAGRVIQAHGDESGATLLLRGRGLTDNETLRTAWVVNCTGPADMRGGFTPVVNSLVETGHLQPDALGLGVQTGERGEGLGIQGVSEGLFVVGTLNKPRVWESTAVPELRLQAATVADSATKMLFRSSKAHAEEALLTFHH